MQDHNTSTPTPSKRIVTLPLTVDQAQALAEYIDLPAKQEGAVFMVFNWKCCASTGERSAEMVAALLSFDEAKSVVNQLRKLFGKAPIAANKKKRVKNGN